MHHVSIIHHRTLAVLLVAALLSLLLAGATASAQGSSVPPWPLLFRGSVAFDGNPVPSGELRVRVGDWESKPVPVEDGAFDCAAACLVAGPPALSYIGQPVSFHLDHTYRADVTFPFPNSATPQQLEVDLAFFAGTLSAPLTAPTPAPQASTEEPSEAPAISADGASGGWTLWFVMGGVLLSSVGVGAWEWRRRARR